MHTTPHWPPGLAHKARRLCPSFDGFSRCPGAGRARLGRVLLALVLAALLPVAGCGQSDHPPLGRVSGKVTLNGKPLPGALVIFHPPKGHISCDTTDAEGHYDLVFMREEHGAIVGKHRVEITTLASETSTKELVPERYNKKTTLEKEVASGSNDFDFDLN